ncbi:unnamed protein product [Boreogadus saida]
MPTAPSVNGSSEPSEPESSEPPSTPDCSPQTEPTWRGRHSVHMEGSMSERNKEGVPLRNPPLHGAPHPGLEASQADLLPLPEAIPDDVNVQPVAPLISLWPPLSSLSSLWPPLSSLSSLWPPLSSLHLFQLSVSHLALLLCL